MRSTTPSGSPRSNVTSGSRSCRSSGYPQASSFHRFAMVSLAIAGRPEYRASDMELRRQGPSYTALTLRDLHAAGWHASQLYFIIGADAFAEIATWYEYPA